jgi:hypothetical protein
LQDGDGNKELNEALEVLAKGHHILIVLHRRVSCFAGYIQTVLVLFLPICAFEVSDDHLEDKWNVEDGREMSRWNGDGLVVGQTMIVCWKCRAEIYGRSSVTVSNVEQLFFLALMHCSPVRSQFLQYAAVGWVDSSFSLGATGLLFRNFSFGNHRCFFYNMSVTHIYSIYIWNSHKYAQFVLSSLGLYVNNLKIYLRHFTSETWIFSNRSSFNKSCEIPLSIFIYILVFLKYGI